MCGVGGVDGLLLLYGYVGGRDDLIEWMRGEMVWARPGGEEGRCWWWCGNGKGEVRRVGDGEREREISFVPRRRKGGWGHWSWESRNMKELRRGLDSSFFSFLVR